MEEVKIVRKAFGLGLFASLTLMVLMVPSVFACGGPPPPEPGPSPGWWRRQVKGWVELKGHTHVTWEQLDAWTGMIGGYYGIAPPEFYGYALVPISSFDTDGDSDFDIVDAYNVFSVWPSKFMRVELANWYNWAAGFGPYV